MADPLASLNPYLFAIEANHFREWIYFLQDVRTLSWQLALTMFFVAIPLVMLLIPLCLLIKAIKDGRSAR